MQALTSAPVTVEIEDARGNKVFKHQVATSKFGVASATFELAREVEHGRVSRTLFGGTGWPLHRRKECHGKKYVLPKFKVSVKTDKAFYQPKETVHGTVQADYSSANPSPTRTYRSMPYL